MLRKKWIAIFGIIAVLALMVSACTTEATDAGMDEPAVEDDMADEELMVDDETEDSQDDNGNDDMEVNDDSADSGNTDTDGSDDDMGDAGAEDDGSASSGGQEASSQLSDEEMEALIKEKAGNQHTLDFILGQNKTYDEWVVTLDRMIGYGADINEDEKELIIQWLINR
ncbi:MAG: hypothetical protein V2J07_02870 [Anaerolineae bacterium]|jgi:hypothetical protein|nr:hypothetical protein [Anaerolineae bacterium]